METTANTIIIAQKERRFMYLPISPETILNLLYPINEANIISKIELPKDVYPVTVHYDYARQEFEVLLVSESFLPIEYGSEIPVIRDNIICVRKYQFLDSI